jgi:HAD superfamily hydrolase (TIGR01549 family)
MDGTLTRANLDFDLIKKEIGVDSGPVLEAMAEMAPQDRARAEVILERHEAEAAAACELQPGARDAVAAIRNSGILTVLMTRNSRKSVAAFLSRHGLSFDLVRTREDGSIKPSPAPILEICGSLGVDPADVWSIGDYHYDIVCGSAAGTRSILFIEEGREPPEWSDEADWIIRDLRELLGPLGITATTEAARSTGTGRPREARP